MTKRLVIHRDHTFEHKGTRYQCMRGGPYGSGDSVWEVWRMKDGAVVGDEFDTLAQIRDYVDKCDENGWSLVEEAGLTMR